MDRAVAAADVIEAPAEPALAEVVPTRGEVARAMEGVALQNLRVVCVVGAALYAALAVVKPLTLVFGAGGRWEVAAGLAGVDAATSAVLLGVYALVRGGLVRPRFANGLLAGAATVVLVAALVEMLAVRDALWTIGFILILLTSAFFVTSPRWFAATLIANVVAWGAAVAVSPRFAGASLVGLHVAEAVVIAVVVFVARYRTIRRLETLHLTNARRADLLAEAVEARSSAQAALAQAFREQKTIMDTIPDFIYELDAQSRLVLWNKRVEEVTGCSAEELRGKPCSEFVVESERALVPGMLRNCELSGFAAQEFHLLRKRGPPVLYEVMKAPILDAAGRLHGFAGVGRDVSGHKAAERRLAAQHAATRVLAEGGQERETMANVLRTIAGALGWSFAALWLVAPDRAVLRCAGAWRAGDVLSEFETITRGGTMARGVGLPGRVWATDEPAWIADVTVDANFPRAAYARAEGFHGAFGFPLRHGGETIGVMEFFSERIEEPDAELLRMMMSIGSQVGLFLQRKRAEAEIWELNARLRERVEDLRAANQDIESFSYSVSHDLRAPIRAVRYFSEMLIEPDQSPEATRDHVARIQVAADRMGEIIEDILRLSQAGRGETRRVHVDLADIARAVAADLRSREPARPVELVVPERLPTEAEPRLVRIVLENLLGNAWKFTRPSAHPRVEVGSYDSEGERVFFVRDNGSGFDVAKADRLFHPFERLHSEKEFEGTGIGLATVKRIVSRHGGRVWADSVLGRGATFFFTLAPPSRPSTDARSARGRAPMPAAR